MGKKPPDLLDVKGAAAELRLSVARVHQLIQDGRLPAQQLGGAYIIKRADLAKVADRKPGRPRKG